MSFIDILIKNYYLLWQVGFVVVDYEPYSLALIKMWYYEEPALKSKLRAKIEPSFL